MHLNFGIFVYLSIHITFFLTIFIQSNKYYKLNFMNISKNLKKITRNKEYTILYFNRTNA